MKKRDTYIFILRRKGQAAVSRPEARPSGSINFRLSRMVQENLRRPVQRRLHDIFLISLLKGMESHCRGQKRPGIFIKIQIDKPADSLRILMDQLLVLTKSGILCIFLRRSVASRHNGNQRPEMVVHMSRVIEKIQKGRHSRTVASLQLSFIGPSKAGHNISLMLVYRHAEGQHIQRLLCLIPQY